MLHNVRGVVVSDRGGVQRDYRKKKSMNYNEEVKIKKAIQGCMRFKLYPTNFTPIITVTPNH